MPLEQIHNERNTTGAEAGIDTQIEIGIESGGELGLDTRADAMSSSSSTTTPNRRAPPPSRSTAPPSLSHGSLAPVAAVSVGAAACFTLLFPAFFGFSAVVSSSTAGEVQELGLGVRVWGFGCGVSVEGKGWRVEGSGLMVEAV